MSSGTANRTRTGSEADRHGREARLKVDMIACDGRGLCAEVLPELITLDDWGFPIIATGSVPGDLKGQAAAAVSLCPRLALRLER